VKLHLSLLALAATSLTLLASSSPALGAQSGWWHLTSGARPAHLHVGGGQSEVQEILTEPAEEFGVTGTNFVVALQKNGEMFVEEFGSEAVVNAFGVTLASAANIQAALEEPQAYGSGNVTVKAETTDRFGKPLAPGAERYLITSVGAASESAVFPIVGHKEIGTYSTRVATVGDSQELYVSAVNVGDASVQAATEAVSFKDVLPAGLTATAVAGTKPREDGQIPGREAVPCSLRETEGRQVAACSYKGTLVPYTSIEMRISVKVQPSATPAEQNEVTVTGGGVSSEALRRTLPISSAPVKFGVEDYELGLEEQGGEPTIQAGAHPYQLTTTVQLNQGPDINPLVTEPTLQPEVPPAGLVKDLAFKLPPGLIGNPTAITQCTLQQFYQTSVTVPGKTIGSVNACPQDSAIGVAVVTVHEPPNEGTVTLTLPVFNVEPSPGEPARFGFYAAIANSPVLIDTKLRTGSDYGVTVEVNNITQTAAFLSSVVTFWGTPGDPSHDPDRGWGCIAEQLNQLVRLPCINIDESQPKPFLALPTSCSAALSSTLEGDSWESETDEFTSAIRPEAPLAGCNRLQFAPELKVAPDGQEASKPSGLSVDVHVPQEVSENTEGLASSNVKDIAVTFPEGVVLNPAAADGLQACPESEVGFQPGLGEQGELLFSPSLAEPFCPDASKVGTVTIKSPLLPQGQNVEGSLYLATPAPNGEVGKNPFNTLVAAYIIAKDPISGTLVKLPGSVSLNGSSGQITSTFENSPQLAFEDAEIHLFGGERAPFATPAHCGAYTTIATFTPWSGTAPVKSSSSFQITQGPNSRPCPPSALPFDPSLAAGSPNINAGSFSALSTTISREDGNQDIQAVSLHMPPGLSGILKGVELCPEASANAGTCAQNSLIGHTIVSVGLGSDPFSVTGGQVFLTEGYKGAPFGLSIVNPAVAGPFDLGKVIVRAKVEVDPHTAQLTVTTDESGPYAIPHILDGIPLQIKHVNVLIDRPGFTFNPTSCNPQAITGTIQSDEGATAPISTSFQVTNCASLKFAPKFTVSTAGKTSKANGASLSVKLTYPSAPAGTYANLAKAKVSLPKQLPSRLTTLQKACTSPVFDQDPGKCPKESIIGQAKVITPLLPVALSGPAYFVSHGGEAFPDLTIVLKGYGVTVDLIGSTQIKNGITTTTFKATPDVPFNAFELTLPQGKFSALAANANLCKSKLTMPSEFQAQNGALFIQQTKIAVSGCPKALTNKQKLAKALKVCHKKKAAKRKACEAQARRRFGAKTKKGQGKKK
jgi:uncharacterized repeat protein (TIGR01451 family)